LGIARFSALFDAPAALADAGAVIRWWEARRLWYIVIVCAVGAASLPVFFAAILASGTLEPGEDAIEPLGLFFGPILLLLVINVFYTLGWLIEASVRVVWRRLPTRFGPWLLGLGLAFSLLVVTAPAWFWVGYLMLQAFGVVT
jgi:hypothetical protein